MQSTETNSIRASFDELFTKYPLIERFTPLHRSRIWSLNAAYWRNRGFRAFTEGTVPFLSTSDGSLAIATAELVAAHAGRFGSKETGQVAIVEIGPGTGIFARLMLRHYVKLQASRPELASLSYIAIDGSPTMIEALKHRSIISVPGCEVDLVEMDLTADLAPFHQLLAEKVPSATMVICVCNYVLDSFPATTLRQYNDALHETQVELRVRATNEPRPGKTGKTLEDLHPDEIVVRTRHRPVAEPGRAAAIAKRFLLRKETEIPFNIQAIEFIRSLATAGSRVDMILVNDYGVDSLNGAVEPLQYFDGSIAMGLHFPTIDTLVSEVLGWGVTVPTESSEMIVSRLYAAQADAELQHDFAELFSLRDTKRAHAWISVARHAEAKGQDERALAAFESALESSPWNWSLLVEAAHFVQACLRRNDISLQIANHVLEANPLCSRAWNIIGDCHYQTPSCCNGNRK